MKLVKLIRESGSLISEGTARSRVMHGWSVYDAITKPVSKEKQSIVTGTRVGNSTVTKIGDGNKNYRTCVVVLTCDCGREFSKPYKTVYLALRRNSFSYSCGCFLQSKMPEGKSLQNKIERNKRWHEKNKEHRKQYLRKWKQTNKHLVRNAENRRRESNSSDIKCVESAALYLIARSNEPVACYICGTITTNSMDRHVDHVTPLSKGGKHSIENLAIACTKCNLEKHDKLLEDFMAERLASG